MRNENEKVRVSEANEPRNWLVRLAFRKPSALPEVQEALGTGDFT